LVKHISKTRFGEQKKVSIETAGSLDLRAVRLARNYWYPVALSKELKRNQMVATQFSADPIVVVRTSAGRLFALEDRCAHRQVPLSRGSVVGERVQCSYHGRSYDAQGTCSLSRVERPEVQAPGVRSYPVREELGLIFVFPGDPSRAADVPLPDLPEAQSEVFVSIPFRRQVRCHYSFLHENLMDMSHQVLHRRWTGDFRPTLLRMRSTHRSVEVDYSAELRAGSALLRLLPGAVIRFQKGKRLSVEARAEDEVTIATDYPYQSLVFHRAGIAEPILKLWNAYIPVGVQEKITQPIGVLVVRRPTLPGLLFLLRPLLLSIAQRIFEEDREMMELEQNAYDQQGTDRTREDAPFLSELRRVLLTRGVG
jgi:phenylpropionate dioxygenase-like ring-hydroxylating dioxygenase large terminal subunit